MSRPTIYTNPNIDDGTTLKISTQLSNISSPEYIVEGIERSHQHMTVAVYWTIFGTSVKYEFKLNFYIQSKYQLKDDSALYEDWIMYNEATKKFKFTKPLNNNYTYSLQVDLIGFTNSGNVVHVTKLSDITKHILAFYKRLTNPPAVSKDGCVQSLYSSKHMEILDSEIKESYYTSTTPNSNRHP